MSTTVPSKKNLTGNIIEDPQKDHDSSELEYYFKKSTVP